MSTAIERTMHHHSDCFVFHEPFQAKYYQATCKSVPNIDMSSVLRGNYIEIRDKILEKSKTVPVFVKDMSYHALPEFVSDPDFSRKMLNVFLVRDPRKSIPSFYKQDKALTFNEIGYEAQWKQYQYLKQLSNSNVLVFNSEVVGRDPKGVMGLIWERGGFSYSEDAFDWSNKPFPKQLENVQTWHKNLTKSNGIYRDNRDPDEVFEASAKHEPKLRTMLEYHKPFYELLSAEQTIPEQMKLGAVS
jgi:hypothetical protein